MKCNINFEQKGYKHFNSCKSVKYGVNLPTKSKYMLWFERENTVSAENSHNKTSCVLEVA